jgi:hypothetical protein
MKLARGKFGQNAVLDRLVTSRALCGEKLALPCPVGIGWIEASWRLGKRSRVNGISGVKCSRPSHREQGILLIECLVYFSIWVLVMGLAGACFHRCLEYSKQLSRNAADIVRVLQVGERWREEVRLATGPLAVIEIEGTEALRIPQQERDSVYVFRNGSVWRGTSTNERWIQVLPGVKKSTMQKEPRQQVVSWRWELELKGTQKAARVRPLFTFEAVASMNQKL